MRKTIKVTSAIIISIICFIFGFRFGMKFNGTGTKLSVDFSSNFYSNQKSLILTKQQIIDTFSYGHNATHLWSMRLADENYFNLARFLSCRTVKYEGEPQPSQINSCDWSSENEFSLPNLLQGQKWLYDHQHPTDCTNKRFAIIHSYALSGLGSTVHQVAWAFGMALADDRIAVYETPGNWVRKIEVIEIKLRQQFICIRVP